MRVLIPVFLGGLMALATPTALAQHSGHSKSAVGKRKPRSLPAGQMKLDQAAAGPGLNKSIIRRYIRRNRSRLLRCYRRQLRVNPRLRGKVMTSFVIAPNGRVALAAATGVSPKVSACIVAMLKRIRFPKPRGGRTIPVYFPFRFLVAPTVNAGGPPGPGHGSLRPGVGHNGVSSRLQIRPTWRMDVRSLAVTGTLGKTIIRRYLRRRRAYMKHCYERQLTIKQYLSGVVRVRFLITAAGDVSTIRAKGLDRTVDKCIALVVRRIKFPKPKGGGIVDVRVRYNAHDGSSPPPGPVAMGGFRGRLVRFRSVGYQGAVLHQTIRGEGKRLARCYKRQLRHKPKLRGKVTARFAIRADGRPTKLVAWGMGAVSGCVAFVMRKLRFPAHQSATPVKVTYELSYGR